jgi:two-component system CheB/CheR fusion protein
MAFGQPSEQFPHPTPVPQSEVATRILIVEDDDDSASALKLVLEFHGFAVDVANTGTMGLQKALASPPDVIVSDLSLPELDGLEMVRRLRADARFQDCRMIAFSGSVTAGESLAAGFDAHFVKPLGIDQLLALFDSWARFSEPPGEE